MVCTTLLLSHNIYTVVAFCSGGREYSYYYEKTFISMQLLPVAVDSTEPTGWQYP